MLERSPGGSDGPEGPFWSVLTVASLLTGLSVCVYLEAVRLTGAYLPCRGAICGQLEHDPLNANPVFKLSTMGLLGYATLLLLLMVATFASPARSRGGLRVARLLSALGFALSIGLVVYVLVRYHGVCPWCEASAVCMGVAALSLVSHDLGAGDRRPWPILAGIGLGLCAFSLLLASQRTHVGSPEVAASYSVAQIAPPGSRLSNEEPRSVALVDFGCGTCRRLLDGLIRRDEPFALRVVPPQTAYATVASRLFYRARGADGRRRVVRALLDDPSMTTLGVQRIERRLAPELAPRPDEGLARDDGTLAHALAIQATPVWIIVDRGKVRLATEAETANASSW